MRIPWRRTRRDLEDIAADAERRAQDTEKLIAREPHHGDQLARLRADSRRLEARNQIAKLVKDGF